MTYTEYKLLIKNIGLNPDNCNLTLTSSMQYFYYGDKFICDDCDSAKDIDFTKVKEIALNSKI